MKALPPPAEICKRRGISLPPIITKCFDETETDYLLPSIIHIRIPISHGAIKDQDCMTPSLLIETSTWSSSSSDYSDNDSENDFDLEEPYKDRLDRYRQFFNNRPLMHCLDTTEDQLLADMLFERLLREVQKPGLPFEGNDRNSRGEMQVRAFWENVRMRLSIDESSLEDEQPEVHCTSPTPTELQVYLEQRGWRSASKNDGGIRYER